MPFTARIDRDACEGHGLCILDNPAVFEMDDDGCATVAVHEVPDERRAKVEGSVRGCPAGAISIDS
ncbi:ferredoxin [Streptomyces sp. NPDC058683]|uniref:ferredoxin n=1 Tax=Streptomyces sp. NPDC058683 TaxID=3346597 RepID=UPI003648B0E5